MALVLGAHCHHDVPARCGDPARRLLAGSAVRAGDHEAAAGLIAHLVHLLSPIRWSAALSDRWSLVLPTLTDRRSLGKRPPVAYADRVMSFVRAHSPEQREVRRATILDTARAMLDEMPVAEVTLNGLSRKSCMAKSNVLRYFESREAVLLELCVEALAEWVIDLEAEAVRLPCRRPTPCPSRADADRRRHHRVAGRASGAVRPDELAGRSARAQRLRGHRAAVQARVDRQRQPTHRNGGPPPARARRRERRQIHHDWQR